MTSNEGNVQGKRYDASSELLIGPESERIKLSEIANDPIFAQCQKVPTYSKALTSTEEEALARRCSVYELQKKVKETVDDRKLASELRTRLLTWVVEGVPEHADTFRRKRKRKQNEQTSDVTENESDDTLENATSHEVEPIRGLQSLQKVQDSVPNAFKFMANPALASAYHQQGGRSDGSAIVAPTPTHLLKNIEYPSSVIEAVSERQTSDGKESRPFILEISIYSRPPRGMWAKEKFDRIVRSVPDSGYHLEEEKEFEDNSHWQDGERFEIPERTKRGPQSMFGRSGPYESLQLAQKIEIRSDATLKDLRDGFYCRMDDIPESVNESEKFKAWNKQVAVGDLSSAAPQMHQYTGQKRRTDSCFLIEDVLYSEYAGQDAYALLLSTHFSKPNEDGAPPRASASGQRMEDVKMDSLELCTGKLYWLLHQGSCEHVWVIDVMRLAREEECKRPNSESVTTFLRNDSAVNPIVRWSRPVKREEAFLFGPCQICDKRPSDMIVAGGGRFRPLNGKETCKGLGDDNVGVCEYCWYTLNGDKVEIAGAGGEGWSVIPLT
ncbi:uncharacterized protein FA14DRAFT_160389 [Meira miltonrushii]|uniref:snRNA-activating protein complex subunit 3 n=1 Tax=Meira miltonrushii TaxID=1280837 RepID=A0A316VBR4_9BASI|nr:uncharacterized protein FA14DRAFT_160389 [Meira miltonrushii]PWN35069.1 hypothetical protein FA14DRAFT_160389 [Meira miltonrushii]